MNIMNAKAALRGERGPPPHFAGRKRELAMMRHRLDIALREHDPAMEGALLITGIPGIGKTHLAYHFAQQATADPNVKALAVDPVDLTSPVGLIRLVGRAMDAEESFARAAGIDDKVSGVRGGVGGLLSGGVTLDTHRLELAFSHLLRATRDISAWRGRALVLVVDEVQSMDSRSADALLSLHTGRHECPILTIVAGLPHSNSVLSEHGVSRMEHLQLDLLSQEEAVEAVCRGLANLGVEVSEHTAEALADASMRFPQHVRGHVEAACVVDERHGAVDSPEALAAALEIGRQSRERYYDGRVNAMGGEAYALYPLVQRMDERAVESLPRSEVESIIGKDVAAAAIQHGVLAKGEHGLLSFGIPSFHSHMAHRAEAYAKAVGRTATPSVNRPR